MNISFDPKKHKYEIDGEPVPSVTQVLGILDKSGPLTWWGMKVGVEGLQALARTNSAVVDLDVDHVVRQLTENKLTVNHIRDTAGTRGHSIHRAAQLWAEEQVIPNPQKFPEQDRGYVRALAHFLSEERPEFLASEVIVGSAEHGYAGTYDARVRMGDRIGILDFKSAKGVYPPFHLQLSAYEHAAVECGAKPTDFQAIVRLDKSGEYELVENKATFHQFLAVLSAFREYAALKSSLKRKVAA